MFTFPCDINLQLSFNMKALHLNLILDSYVGLMAFFILPELIGAPGQLHP